MCATEYDKNFIVKDNIDLTDMGNWEPIAPLLRAP